MINKVGRFTHINFVLSTLPNHIMACVLLPAGLLDDMEKLKISFMWGHDQSKKKLHYFSWKTCCALLHSGGLGIRDLHAFQFGNDEKEGMKTLDGQCPQVFGK